MNLSVQSGFLILAVTAAHLLLISIFTQQATPVSGEGNQWEMPSVSESTLNLEAGLVEEPASPEISAAPDAPAVTPPAPASTEEAVDLPALPLPRTMKALPES